MKHLYIMLMTMGLMSCTKESITDIYLQTHDTITIYSYAFDTESA